jgi:hypothetical protein
MGASIDTSLIKVSTAPERAVSSGSSSRTQAQRDGASSAKPAGTTPDGQTDRVTLSEEALRKVGLLKAEPKTEKAGAPPEKKAADAKKSSDSASSKEAAELANMKRRDLEVRTHEQAHISAGGSLVRGGASFGYATGPDGRLYAVSGEVSIDSSPVQDDPQATIRKMSQVTRAALAPAQPSGQDRAVASAAAKEQMTAQQQSAQQQVEKMQGGGKSGESAPGGAAEAKKAEKSASGGAPEAKKAEKSASGGAPEAKKAEKSASGGALEAKRTGKSTQIGAPDVNKAAAETQAAANRDASNIFALGANQPKTSKQATVQPKHVNLWA